jgi:hypothetical protein
MGALRFKAVTYDYDPATHSLHVVGTDENNQVVTVEIMDVYPAQLVADLEVAQAIGRPLYDWQAAPTAKS